jgi:hypothetical protein
MWILNYSHTSRLTRPLSTSLWLGTPSPSIVCNTRPIRLFRTTLLSLSVCPLVVVFPRLHALRSDFSLLPTATCLFFSQTLKPPSVPWSVPVLYRRLLLLMISKHSLQIWLTLSSRLLWKVNSHFIPPEPLLGCLGGPIICGLCVKNWETPANSVVSLPFKGIETRTVTSKPNTKGPSEQEKKKAGNPSAPIT